MRGRGRRHVHVIMSLLEHDSDFESEFSCLRLDNLEKKKKIWQGLSDIHLAQVSRNGMQEGSSGGLARLAK